jgi:adenylate cyclase
MIYACLVLLLLAAAVALRLADPVPVARLRLIAFDAYQQIWPRTYDPSLPVRVVEVDEGAIRKFGQWPWPRTVIAELTRRLADLGAAVVAYDFVMSEPDRLDASEVVKWFPKGAEAEALGEQIKKLPSGDAAFAEAMARVPVVVGFIGVGAHGAAPAAHAGFAFAGDNPALFVPGYDGAIKSLPVFEEKSAGEGSLNWVPEFDQVVRRVPLLVRVGDQLYPSLSAEALRVAQRASTFIVKASGASSEESFGRATGITAMRIGDFEVPTDANGQIWLHFTGADARRVVPLSKVMDGDVRRDELEGRIVLVGMGAAGLSDIKTTPLDASIAGVEVHAQAIEQMMIGDHVRRLDFAKGAELVFVVLGGLLLAAVVYRVGALWSGAVGAGILIGAVATSLASYRLAGLLFDPVYPTVALSGIYLSTTVYRYFQTEAERMRVRNTFGRYLTDDVVTALLESPAGQQIGGEKGKVTMMMTDLRGFTSLSERVEPEQVVRLLNNYFAAMIQIIEQYGGTIDEFIGDAIFVLFGAPIRRDDDAKRAIACAVDMQRAMTAVNEDNRANGLPEVEMGIGLHTGQVVVGNIGSPKRMKYGVIGSNVNLAARIQSFTIAGQVLISEATREEAEGLLSLGRRLEFKAKGVERPVAVYEVLGIGEPYNLFLSAAQEPLSVLQRPIGLRYSLVEGAQLGAESYEGEILKLSSKEIEARLATQVPVMSNLGVTLRTADGHDVPGSLYGKVMEVSPADGGHLIRITAMPPEVAAFLRETLAQSGVERPI